MNNPKHPAPPRNPAACDAEPEGWIITVGVDIPVDRTFDYHYDRGSTGPATPTRGLRVKAPFSGRVRVGIVVATRPNRAPLRSDAPQPDSDCERRLDVARALDDRALIPESLLNLVEFVAQHYHHPLGACLRLALPPQLRRPRPVPARAVPEGWQLTPAGLAVAAVGSALATDPAEQRAATPTQRAMLQALARAGGDRRPITAAEWRSNAEPEDAFPSRTRLHRAVERGWLEARPVSAETASHLAPIPPAAVSLTSEQTAVVQRLRRFVTTEAARAAPRLLVGVTGSGKTEIYLHAAHDALSRNGSVLILVPEIALTPQLIGRFTDWFQTQVAVLHSGQSAGERTRAWLALRDGRARIALGTRSAVFAPLGAHAPLTLIIVDEEHDPAYKQTGAPTYHARDLAVVRGHQCGAQVLLGSATPSLESLLHARSGRYQPLFLRRRPDGSAPPTIRTIDLRVHTPDEGLSTPLLGAVEQALGRGEQAFLLLNRRGYAPALICPACDWVADCPRCDARLTLHHGATPHRSASGARAICHHCGHHEPAPAACPRCGADLDPRGVGTQRLERALRAHFPAAPLIRLDRDTLGSRDALEHALAKIRQTPGCIVVGTQLIAKGHDFPDVGLVAILEIDGGLFSADLRAAEHTAQRVIQVSGRALRRAGQQTEEARVLLQTHHPDHPLLQTLLAGGYERAADALLEERRAAAMPPYVRAALIRLESRDRSLVLAAGETLATACRGALPPRPAARVFGPAQAPRHRLDLRFREQILLLAPRHAELAPLIHAAQDAFSGLRPRRDLRWIVDVDPISLD